MGSVEPYVLQNRLELALLALVSSTLTRFRQTKDITGSMPFKARAGRYYNCIMTVMLELRPEVEATLLAQAQANGMSLEEYLLSMVEGAAVLAVQRDLSPEKRAAAFEAWSAGHRSTPDLSDQAISRESMYQGRDH